LIRSKNGGVERNRAGGEAVWMGTKEEKKLKQILKRKLAIGSRIERGAGGKDGRDGAATRREQGYTKPKKTS